MKKQVEKLSRAVGILRKYEKTNDVKLEDEEFSQLIHNLYEGGLLDHRDEKIEFLLNHRHLLA